MTKQFDNIDKVRQSDSHVESEDSANEILRLDNGKKATIRYSKHFADRLNHTKDGVPEPITKANPDRRLNKQGMKLPFGSIKTHIRKITKYISDNISEFGKSGKMVKHCFIHRPTGHKIVTHTRVTPNHVDITAATYLNHEQPVDDFEDAPSAKNKYQQPGKVMMLEQLILALLKEKIESNQIVTIELD
jgi:hypothetical protein